jgi:hypothetical protein
MGDSPFKVCPGCYKCREGLNGGRLGGIADAVGGGDEKPLFMLHIGRQAT